MSDDAIPLPRQGDEIAPARAQILSRRTMIAGGLLAGASVIANLKRPDTPVRMLGKAKLDDIIPKQVGSWSYTTDNGLVLPPPDQMRDRIYSSLLTRYYASRTEPPVMLLIAYSSEQDGMIQVHRPEVCYPAAGYELSGDGFKSIDVGHGLEIPGHYFSARSNTRREQLIYWTRIGDAFPTKWWAQHVAVAAENLKGHIPDGVLVRISTAASDDREALRILTRFTETMARKLPPRARLVLFGHAGAPGLT